MLGPDADPAATDRARIAEVRGTALRGTDHSPNEVSLIEALARFQLPTTAPEHIARSLATAPDVVSASSRVDWHIIISVAGWEHGHPLAPRRASCRAALPAPGRRTNTPPRCSPRSRRPTRAARRLLLEAQVAGRGRCAAVRAARGPGTRRRREAWATVGGTAAAVQERGEREVDAATVGEVTAILGSLTRQGKRVQVSWQVLP